ncbi:hypothetical protein [Kutzneria chonburiensis]|uniref:Uncharacterized protein n=1 Tax=Kutzneria chonburiensis TaxID=1483604 RepID=A0ABV6N8H2_9PSEU|nr:hypothetical protein [Kutzneria chonburiensis]
MRKLIAAASVLTALVAPVALTGTASASPAASCTYYTVENDWYCNNKPGIAVTYAYKIVGYLDTGRNAFDCRYDSGDYHGGPHPYRWIYTQADHTGKYGFVSDNDIYDNTDPLRSC